MVLRKLAVALLGVGVLLPGLSHALAIGDIRTKSALGEPFRGEVELSEIGDLTADEIRAGLASQEEFERLGIEKVYFLNDLRFEVEVKEGGKAILKISTVKPVSEPFLDFVVRVNWPGNTNLKSMTALLDPPVSQAAPAPVSKPVATVTAPVSKPAVETTPAVVETKPVETKPVESKPVEPKAETKPAPQKAAKPAKAETPAAPKESKSAAETAAPDTYTTKANESLWAVALKVRPTKSVSVHQTMIAIQRNNKDAFGNNNINELKRGQILRIPSEAQIREISSQEAIQSVNEQNNAWKHLSAQTTEKPAKLESAQVNATAKPVAEAKPAVEAKPEMKLVAPEGGKHSVATGGKEEAAKKPDAATAKKVAANEQKAAEAKKANEKLGADVKVAETKVKENDAKLKLQDAKLAELQAQLKQQQEKAAQQKAAKPVEPPKPAVAEQKKPEEVKAPEVAAEQKPADAQAPVAAAPAAEAAKPPVQVAKPEAPKAKVEEPAPAEEGSPLVPVLIGGVLALAGGVAAYLFKRRKDQKAEEEALAEIEQLEEGESEVPSFPNFDETPSLDSDLDGLDLGGDQTLLSEAAAPAVDPLEEAEGYIAYGRYPQAIGFLSKAIAAEPDRSDLRVKLLECYAATNDHEGFAAVEAELENQGDLDGLSRADELRGTMSAAPQVAKEDDGLIEFEPSTGGESDDLMSLEDLEMDFNQSISASSANLKAIEEPALELDAGLDFDLGGVEEAAPVVEAADEFSLDVADLELDAPKQESVAAAAVEDDLATLDFDAGTDFSLDEPAEAPVAELDADLSFELAEEPVAEVQSHDRDVSFDLGDIELAELDTDVTPSEKAAVISDDDLSFSLDDLDVAEVAPVSAAETSVADDFAALDLEEVPVSAADNELTLDDLDSDFSLADEAALESEPVVDFDATPSSDLQDAAAEFDLALAEPEVAVAEEPSFEPVFEAAPQVEEVAGVEDDFDFLADADENATKLDLAKAYIDMGDMEGARDILQEVLSEGNSDQQEEARGLMAQVG